MKERVLQIGKPTPLAAVITEPATIDTDSPAVIILNAALMHHVGTCRISVKIARALAQANILSVRFDFSSVGDSEPRRGHLSSGETAIREVQEVLDFLQKTRGISHFILYGLCSGGDVSYLTALADPRVVGIVKIDPYCYRTWQYPIRYYAPLLFDRKRWASFLEKKLSKKSIAKIVVAEDSPDSQYFEVPSYTRQVPPREEVAAGLGKLVARGAHIFAIFTGDAADYIYPGQYRDSFKEVNFGTLLRADYYPGVNHIMTSLPYQTKIVDAIVGWVVKVADSNRIGSKGATATT